MVKICARLEVASIASDEPIWTEAKGVSPDMLNGYVLGIRSRKELSLVFGDVVVVNAGRGRACFNDEAKTLSD